jgi:ribonuclease BN (tRNA processing enzyme)
MFRIHVLNVKLGDSIVLETDLESQSYYSIIDCKSIEGKAPTVEFLRARGITRIQSLFLTHLHNDHYSGFPQLLDYLRGVNGSLEYFVSPQIPDEIDIWRKILQMAHDQTTSAQLTSVLKAMKGLQELPSLTQMNKKVNACPDRLC